MAKYMNKTINVISLALTISAILASIIIPGAKSVSANANPLSNIFSDTQSGNIYFNEVSCLSGSPYGIIAGYPDGTFKPNQNITRGEATAFISRYHVAVLGDWSWKNPATPSFTDVPSSYLYFQQIETARFYGFVSGIGNNMFAPADPWMYGFGGISVQGTYGAPITRGEFIKALYNYGLAHNQIPACVTQHGTPAVDLKVNTSDGPITVDNNTNVNVSWISSDVTSCTASGRWSGSKATNNSEQVFLFNNTSSIQTADFVINCSGPDGSKSDSVTVSVRPSASQNDPTVDIKANNSDNPSAIAYGTSANLSWTSTNAVSCNATGSAWSGSRNVNDSQSTGALTTSKTYTITCYNSVGVSATDSVTVPVNPQQVNDPTVDLTANPTSFTSGNRSSLAWTSSNADYCYASGGPWSGSNLSANSSQQTGVLTQTSVFSITCVNSSTGRSATDSATVTVNSDNSIAVTLTANPSSVNQGGSSILNWTSTNASYCFADSSAWYGNKAITSGSEQVTNLQSTRTYKITCTNAVGNSASDEATVNVQNNNNNNQAPILNLYANPSVVSSGSYSTLYWNTTNADYCIASGDSYGNTNWSGNKPVNSSQSVGPINVTQNYILTCYGPGGSVVRNTTVSPQGGQVLGAVAPTLTIYAIPTPVQYGSVSTVYWNAQSVDACYAMGSWYGTKPTSGQSAIGPLFADSTYTLTCQGLGGTITRSAVVPVIVPIPVYAPPVYVSPGQVQGITGSYGASIEKTIQNSATGQSGSTVDSRPGNDLKYTITVRNTGTLTLTNLVVKDPLSDRVEIRSISDNGTYDYTNRTVTWKISRLTAGDSKTLTLVVRVNQCDSGLGIENRATVSNSQISETSSNNTIAGISSGLFTVSIDNPTAYVSAGD